MMLGYGQGPPEVAPYSPPRDAAGQALGVVHDGVFTDEMYGSPSRS